MPIMDAVLWALVGAIVAEAFQLSVMVRAKVDSGRRGRPWSSLADLWLIGLAVLLRVLVGTGLAAAGAASGQICDAGPAFVTGLAGPLLVAKIFQIVTAAPPMEPALLASVREDDGQEAEQAGGQGRAIRKVTDVGR